MSSTRPASFKVYLVVLYGVVIGALAWGIADDQTSHQNIWQWAMFTLLLGVTEAMSLFFHRRGARYSLSASEVVLLPMFMALSFPQAVLGAVIGNTLGRLPRWRAAPFKEVFNAAQYGCAAAGGAAVWAVLHDGMGFTPRKAAVGALSVLVVASLSHVFVAGAIALSGEGRFRDVSLAIANVFLVNLAGDLILGLLFAASYAAAEWTLFLFAFPLGALFLGYRAVIRQSKEKERVEHLHTATRALSSTPDLGDALAGFLQAAGGMLSADRVLAIVDVQGNHLWSAVAGSAVLGSLEPVGPAGMTALLDLMQAQGTPFIVHGDDTGPAKEIGADLGFRNFVAVPLVDGTTTTGVLVAADREDAGGFEDAEERLLEALAEELLVRLESHRLFSEVVDERERFERIFTGSKEGICLLDTDGVVRAWNPALERITGYSSDAVMDRRWSDVIVIRDQTENRVQGDELVGYEPDEELEVVTKSGPSRWVTTVSGPLGDAEGSGWVILVRDVTAEHEVEAAKSDFLSTISHELRTPLTTIKGSLQVLARGRGNIPDKLANQMVDVTTRGAERLERLVMNLLAVSQIENGTMAVFPDTVDLTPIVRDRINALLHDHPETRLDVPEEPLVVRADRERMSHVVEHLLENAAKFGGQGEIKIEIAHEGGYARLSVSDNGPGIAPENHERIFERFVRLGEVMTRETQGAGIGLFIAQRSVEAMGGRIWVESNLGEGATFHVSIPMAHPIAVADAADSA